MRRRLRRLAAALVAALAAAAASAQTEPETPPGEVLVSLDFTNAELAEVIDTIARLTNRNFIYDDRVRGRVTIVSPTKIPLDQAYAVFESVLQVKGFTTVESPGGAIKVIPIREAKESSVETEQSAGRPENRDHFVTRLIPLRYIEADPIVNTLKPLVSKDAAMVAYAPTNTVILTESASNIRRIISILEAIDVETYKEDLAVLKIEHADAATLADQISEIYGADVTGAGAPTGSRARRATRAPAPPTPVPVVPGAPPGTSRVRIITDERTNSLIVLAARQQLADVRNLVAKLDVPVTGGGRIHVYYLQNADAEELANTLNALITGQPQGPTAGQGAGAGAQVQALRASVSALAEGISVTADPATNSLVIQASQEGFSALSAVIEKLDVQRPQVLVEALIMEVDVSDNQALGFDGILRIVNGDTAYNFVSGTGQQLRTDVIDGDTGGDTGTGGTGGTGGTSGTVDFDDAARIAGTVFGGPVAGALAGFLKLDDSGDVIGAVIRAAATDGSTNIISAPHILTSDNEQAEIRIGDNIPIITSRVQSAQGQNLGLSSSVNVERQDIGVTLRVTPQITEGDTLRLEIFQEITAINSGLIQDTGNPEEVGVPLSNRRIENTVVVGDGETVVIGGLISEDYQDTLTKVPWLGDVPILGWLFKSTAKSVVKKNLLVFLTPHVMRQRDDLELATIHKREEFKEKAGSALALETDELEREAQRKEEAEAAGVPYFPEPGRNPVRLAILGHESRYPLERMREIERQQAEDLVRGEAEGAVPQAAYFVQAAIFGDPEAASQALTALIDAGFDGTLISSESGGAMLYEIRLGPFETIDEAGRVSEVVRRAHGLAPSVLVAPPEQP